MAQILTMLRNFFLLSTSVILLLACGDNKNSTDVTATQDSGAIAKTESGSSSSGPVRSSIKVTIKDGPMAGTYNAECREGCTSYGIAGENVFGNQYSETDKGPKDLSSVQLIIDDVTGDKQTKEFLLTVSLGDWVNGKSTDFNINTRKGKSDGSGTADVDYSGGEQATVKIVGKSKEGPELEVEIDAQKLVTPNNLGQ
jgi:hypothetical protein